jgi:CubicO group peptidase (beta-lactamase class C family)
LIIPRIKTAGERWEDVAAGGYGYGLYIFSAGDRFRVNGALVSRSGFGHVGYGGAYIWADPEQDVVGVYLSVSPRLHRDVAIQNSDLFQNAAHAAIID